MLCLEVAEAQVSWKVLILLDWDTNHRVDSSEVYELWGYWGAWH